MLHSNHSNVWHSANECVQNLHSEEAKHATQRVANDSRNENRILISVTGK